MACVEPSTERSLRMVRKTMDEMSALTRSSGMRKLISRLKGQITQLDEAVDYEWKVGRPWKGGY